MSSCANCFFDDKLCKSINGRGLNDCPTKENKKEIEAAMIKYEQNEYKRFSREAARQEGAGYNHDADGEEYACKTRLQETVEFCRRMNYKKLGLVFCLGLQREASILNGILESNGFEVTSVVCKVGNTSKEDFGIEKESKINPEKYESMCNPIGQAEICNAEHTEFNIVLGLCVGHDSLFLKNSSALCTVFAVKDRALAHNPLGAIYTSHSYYKRLKKPIKIINK